MADPKIMQAKEPFSADVDGSPIGVSTDDLFYADDPVVVGREHLFGELTVRRTGQQRERASGATETTTAAPGERRTVSRPAPDQPTRPGRPTSKGG